MSIHDFYSKFVSMEEESSLLGTLRRLSLFENPTAMFEEEPLNDGIPGGSLTDALVLTEA